MSDLVGNPEYRFSHNEAHLKRYRDVYCRSKRSNTVYKVKECIHLEKKLSRKLQSNKIDTSDTERPFLDLHLSISSRFVSSKIYDKRDDFDFDIAKNYMQSFWPPVKPKIES